MSAMATPITGHSTICQIRWPGAIFNYLPEWIYVSGILIEINPNHGVVIDLIRNTAWFICDWFDLVTLSLTEINVAVITPMVQMETFSALLAICAENSPVPGEFPAQRPLTRNFDVFFVLCLNKRLS